MRVSDDRADSAAAVVLEHENPTVLSARSSTKLACAPPMMLNDASYALYPYRGIRVPIVLPGIGRNADEPSSTNDAGVRQKNRKNIDK